MSSEAAIEAEGLAKSYLVYDRPADRLKQAVAPRLHRLLGPLARGRPEPRFFREHHALRPLSFTIPRGETVGIVGRNGSGKSTLLQLVCGTLTPSAGEVRVAGRVAALLELGSGFNPEYTGIENVFLNASVLGLSREDTERRLPEILAFADIGEFVHQPVKTYSSGMVMRLAFAVIAHVDADILVIDEALAVGDAFFQQKCLRWLKRFQERGTILFCAHDAAAVVGLCTRAIWLDKGVLRMQGEAKAVMEAYSSFIAAEVMGLPAEAVKVAEAKPEAAAPAAPEAGWRPVPEGTGEYGSGLARITHLRLLDAATGREPSLFTGGMELALEMRIAAAAPLHDLLFGVIVKDRLGTAVLSANNSTWAGPLLRQLPAGGCGVARLRFQLPHLAGGTYVLGVAVASGTQAAHVQHHWVHEALPLPIHQPHALGALLTAPLTEAALEARDPLAPAG